MRPAKVQSKSRLAANPIAGTKNQILRTNDIMATANVAVEAKTLKIQKTVFDLVAFDNVTLAKEFAFTPVTSRKAALELLGGDEDKLLGIINEGLASETRRKVAAEVSGWKTLNDDGEVGGEFNGTIADPKAVNTLVLTLAKTVFGYSKDMSADEKRTAKENAVNMIKSTPAIRAGLQKSAGVALES